MKTPIWACAPLLLALCAAPLAAQAPAGPAAAAAAPHPQPTPLQLGAREGSVAAQATGTGTWTLSGFAGGLVLGPIGAGLAYALASGSGSALPADVTERIGNREADYQLGFQQGYTQRLTARRTGSAAVGGMAGTVVFVIGSVVALSRF